MNNQSRKRNSVLNSLFGVGTQCVIMACQFIIQTVFIKTLGAEYLGLNGLFTNVLQFLALAELGVGGSITFSLYAPIARNDTRMIASIMRLYRKAYSYIGVFVLIIGLIVSLFLNFFISETDINHVKALFVLFLLNSVVSYFFAYRRTLFVADQRSYIDSINKMIFRILQVIFQVTFLITTHNYVAYLVIQIIVTLIGNMSIFYKSQRMYPFLRSKNKTYVQIESNVMEKMKKNVLGSIASKIAYFVMFGTDNLLISKFIGLSMVGVYSNYMLIFNSVSMLLSQMLSPLASSIANYVNDENTSDTNSLFFRYMYIVNSMTLIIGAVLSMVTNIFIVIWLGDQYVLSATIFAAVIFNWMIHSMRLSILSFMTAFGTYWETRWKAIIESAVNLFVGLFLITKTDLGVMSVVIGSLSANLLVNAWLEPLILFKKDSSLKVKKYVFRYCFYLLVAASISIAPLLIVNDVMIPTIFNFCIMVVLVFVVFGMFYFVITIKFPENAYMRNLIKSFFLKNKYSATELD